MLGMKSLLVAGCAAIALAAGCSGSDDPQLLEFKSTGSPDELGVMPSNPLELPQSLGRLPEPRTGGVDRAYPKPELDVIRALDGDPNATLRDRTVPEADVALIRYASRGGLIKNIRGVLASEDLEFRRRNDGRLMEKLFNTNIYYRAYAPFSLDQEAEFFRAKRLGIKTPGAEASIAATKPDDTE